MSEKVEQLRPQEERRSNKRKKMEQSLRVHESWLNSLDYRVSTGDLNNEQKNKMIALAMLKRENKLTNVLEKSEIDSMTGLYRQEYLKQEVARRIQRNEPFAMLFTDLDNFGEINKKYGQIAGDEIIIEAALRLTEGLRGDIQDEDREDKPFRIGGDETAIILSGISSQDQLKTTAERIRQRMESAPFQIPLSNQKVFLTISIGGTIWKDEQLDTFMNNASQSLIQAKSRRNITVIK